MKKIFYLTLVLITTLFTHAHVLANDEISPQKLKGRIPKIADMITGIDVTQLRKIPTLDSIRLSKDSALSALLSITSSSPHRYKNYLDMQHLFNSPQWAYCLNNIDAIYIVSNQKTTGYNRPFPNSVFIFKTQLSPEDMAANFADIAQASQYAITGLVLPSGRDLEYKVNKNKILIESQLTRDVLVFKTFGKGYLILGAHNEHLFNAFHDKSHFRPKTDSIFLPLNTESAPIFFSVACNDYHQKGIVTPIDFPKIYESLSLEITKEKGMQAISTFEYLKNDKKEESTLLPFFTNIKIGDLSLINAIKKSSTLKTTSLIEISTMRYNLSPEYLNALYNIPVDAINRSANNIYRIVKSQINYEEKNNIKKI